MSAAKRMTAKEDFLNMPLKDRNCEDELFENCRTRMLLEKCACVPWELPVFKVRFPIWQMHCIITTTLRVCKCVAPKEEIALRITLLILSTALQLAEESMQTSNGLEIILMRR